MGKENFRNETAHQSIEEEAEVRSLPPFQLVPPIKIDLVVTTSLQFAYTCRSAKDSETDLCLLIAQRRDERKGKVDSMFSSLISRYGGNAEAEPTEEEFEAAQRRLESKRSSKKSRGT